jgi:hypothetical protein
MTPEQRAAAITEGWADGDDNCVDGLVGQIRADIAAAIREAEAEAYARGRRDGEWCARHPEEMPTWEGESR